MTDLMKRANAHKAEHDDRSRADHSADGGVLFPVAPDVHDLPNSYPDFIQMIISDITKQKIQTFLQANADMICLYWRVGNKGHRAHIPRFDGGLPEVLGFFAPQYQIYAQVCRDL